MKNQYILMGDVVDSESQVSKTKLVEALNKQVTHVNQKFKETILSPLTITLGDEFQGVLADPVSLCNALFELEESALTNPVSYTLRYSAYLGPIDTALNNEAAHGMYGKGLTVARKRLEAMKTQKVRFSVDFIQPDVTQHLQLLFGLYQSTKDKWSPSHYELINHYLHHPDYNSLYEAGFYKTKAGAWKIVQSLGLHDYLNIKKLILQTLKWLD
ncbi:MAG: SatD family protein [Cyclobacteriaceae bacterium]